MIRHFYLAATTLLLFFSLATATAAEKSAPVETKEKNITQSSDTEDDLTLEDKERQIDKNNMLKIHRAIFAYFKDHGDLPDYLSTLVPKYLPDSEVLMSPKEKRTGKSVLYGRDDPKLDVSYIYEFNADIAPEAFNRNRKDPITCKQWKLMQLEQFGLITPMLRCHLHSPVLNVSYSGDFFESGLLWENDPRATVLLRQKPELGPFKKLSSKQTLKVKVINADDDKPLPKATVRVALGSEFGLLPNQTRTTDHEGNCTLPLGDWQINYMFVDTFLLTHLPNRYHWNARQADDVPQPKELTIRLHPAKPALPPE